LRRFQPWLPCDYTDHTIASYTSFWDDDRFSVHEWTKTSQGELTVLIVDRNAQTYRALGGLIAEHASLLSYPLAFSLIACFSRLRREEEIFLAEAYAIGTQRTLISPTAELGAIVRFQARVDLIMISRQNLNDLCAIVDQLKRCEQSLEHGMIPPGLKTQFEAWMNQNGEMLGNMQDRVVKNYDELLTHAQMRLSLVSSLFMRVALKASIAGTLWLTKPRRSNMKCRCCTLVISPKHVQTRL
jgi:hypothetical protein